MIMKQAGTRPKKSPVVLIVILAVVVVALVAGGVGYYLPYSTPEKTVNLFIAAMKAKDTAALKNCLSSASQQQDGESDTAIDEAWNSIPKEVQSIQMTTGTATINGNTATVPVKFALPKELAQFGISEIPIPLGLVREKLRWKIDNEETRKAVNKELPNMLKGLQIPGGSLGGGMPALPGR